MFGDEVSIIMDKPHLYLPHPSCSPSYPFRIASSHKASSNRCVISRYFATKSSPHEYIG